MTSISYTSGRDFQLNERAMIKTEIRPSCPIRIGKIMLRGDGMLVLDPFYAWDGPSGPPKTLRNLPIIGLLYWRFCLPSFQRGSLAHDALYELMRWDLLDREIYREQADLELWRICRADGMSRLRAWWVYRGVRAGGRTSTLASRRRRIYYAP